MEGKAINDNREKWTSRTAFYFAAVGSAVGFGNIWRFPSLVFEYGGGAFFIPYVMALVFIGIPLLVLEIGLGQYYVGGDVQIFATIHKRLAGVGVCSVACGYMLVTYYSMLLAWVVNAFFDSFTNNIWAQEQVTGEIAVNYFYDTIIGSGTVGEDQLPTRIVWENVGYSALTWFIVWLCIAFGLKWTGRITYFTMGLPIVMLFIFLGRALSLPGSSDGVNAYIGNANWSILWEKPEVWSKAVTQIFFSLGVTFGIMTAYGSHCERSEPTFMNSCVVAFSNCLFSFIAGFAVFATMGHLAFTEGIDDLADLNYSGFGLVFGSWPVVLGTLSGGEHWIRLFFVMLFLLGLDSAFSFVEAFLTVLQDAPLFEGVVRWKICLGLTVTAWLLSLIYATDAGLNFLDVIDYYINFVMLLVGGFEAFAAGWIFGIEDQISSLGANVVFAYMVTTFGSITLACCLWFGISGDSALWAGFVGLILSYAIGMMFVTYLMSKNKTGPFKSMFYELMFKNVIGLKNDLSAVVGYIPTTWALLIKHFIPPVVIILFANLCNAETSSGDKTFGHYGGYPFRPYQILGILCVIFVAVLFFSSVAFPRMYDAFLKSDDLNPKLTKEDPEAKDVTESVNESGVFMENAPGSSAVAVEMEESSSLKPVDEELELMPETIEA